MVHIVLRELDLVKMNANLFLKNPNLNNLPNDIVKSSHLQVNMVQEKDTDVHSQKNIQHCFIQKKVLKFLKL